jgi:ABC-type glycerol-3-phosphate transport system permease component
MSNELSVCLIAVTVNLIAMLLIYSAISHAMARRGTAAVVVLIVISQLSWIAPAIWIVERQGASEAGSYALWLGNWLVTGFSLVVFGKSAARIPIALEDAARIDGLGGLAAWRHTVLPFVRRDLVIVGVFTVMATLLPFWGVINQPHAGEVITIFVRGSTLAEHLVRMVAGSLLGTVPLIAIFFFAKRAR